MGNAYLVVTERVVADGEFPDMIRVSPCSHRIVLRALSKLLARTHSDVIVIRQPVKMAWNKSNAACKNARKKTVDIIVSCRVHSTIPRSLAHTAI